MTISGRLIRSSASIGGFWGFCSPQRKKNTGERVVFFFVKAEMFGYETAQNIVASGPTVTKLKSLRLYNEPLWAQR